MSKLKEPVLYLNGRGYTAKTLRVRDWYNFMAFEDKREDISLADYFNKMAGIIASLFIGVTADDILDKMALEDIKPFYQECYRWVLMTVNSKLGELPNGETGKE